MAAFAGAALAAVLCAQPAAGNGQQPARDTSASKTAPPSGSLSGRIVAGDTGRPIRRARVLVRAPELPDGRGVLTDDDGRYQISELPAGRYTVRASRPGYLSLSYGQRRPQQTGTPVQLADGQALKSVDFRLPKGAVISGRIVDETGDPTIGATIRVLRYQYLQGDRRLMPVDTTRTDDRGEYRVWGLDPGDYLVSAIVRNPGSRFGRARGAGGGTIAVFADSGADEDDRDGYAPTYYPGTTVAGDARPVTVGIGQEKLGVDFGVQLVRTSRISGRVMDADGSACSTGSISLMPDGVRGQAGITYSTRIDWDGAFSIPNVPPGRYVARAVGNDADTPQFASAPVTVAGGDIADFNLVLAASATLAGAVVFRGQQAVAGDPGSVRISAVPADRAAFGPTPGARVAKDGRFTLEGIPSGAHFVRSVNPPRGWTLLSITLAGRDLTDTAIDFRPGETVAGAVVTFTDQLTRISGTLTDDSGNAVTEYTVLAFPVDASLWRPSSRQIMVTRPDQNGRYQMRGLPPGDYYLAAVDPAEADEWFEPAFLDQQRPNAARLALAEGDAKTQDFKIPAR